MHRAVQERKGAGEWGWNYLHPTPAAGCCAFLPFPRFLCCQPEEVWERSPPIGVW